ncbi:MAG: hypothetical protein R3C31_10395 [Hyphomonadaceae bacterium]
MRVLDHDDRRIDSVAPSDGVPESDMMLASTPLQTHHQKGGRDAQRQRNDGHHRRTDVEEEKRTLL